MIRKIIILCSAFFLSLSPVMAEKSPEAEAFVVDVSNRVIDILSYSSSTEKEDAFRKLLNEKANLKRIAALHSANIDANFHLQNLKNFNRFLSP